MSPKTPTAYPDCPACGARKVRNPKHDAYYCPACDVWLEPTCGNEPCASGYCTGRPEKPSEVIE